MPSCAGRELPEYRSVGFAVVASLIHSLEIILFPLPRNGHGVAQKRTQFAPTLNL
jgi:hypothetical protein